MSVSVFCLTFNCAKLKLSATDLGSELQGALPETPPELFVFGFQEMCSIMDGCFYASSERHLVNITNVLLYTLKTKYNSSACHNFSTVGIHHVGAIGLVVITPFASKITSCSVADAGCGIARSSLKGGVGIRIGYTSSEGSTELTFATAHLAANEGELQYRKRVEDVTTIMRAMKFSDGFSFLKPHSHAIFMGDLNFRTTKDIGASADVVQQLIDLQDASKNLKDGEIPEMLSKYDELTKGRKEGEMFSGFEEAPISFRPTYKFHLNTAIYNSKRSPSWCDRILYQATYKDAAVQVDGYNALINYLSSDHRPVYLALTLPLAAPEAIIDRNGYLQVLPTRFNKQTAFSSSSYEMSGPTQLYMKFTAYDAMNQYLIRRIVDFTMGYSLWISTTSRGRVTLLAILLLGVCAFNYLA